MSTCWYESVDCTVVRSLCNLYIITICLLTLGMAVCRHHYIVYHSREERGERIEEREGDKHFETISRALLHYVILAV